ncbi:MAG: hypothetical protein R6V04_01355 [bacterium]
MSENTSRIYLKIGEIEISIEGSPDYVKEQYQQMAKDLNLQQKLQGKSKETEKPKTNKATQPTKAQKKTSKQRTQESTAKKDFSELLSNPPKGTKNNDLIILAGYLNQLNSNNNNFRIRDVNNTLKNNGIKITNPSSVINYIVKKKNVITQVKKEGRQNYYQITKEGEKYIKNLLKTKEK